ncbi:MAG: hypothetical protein V2J24_20045 [Pseudomonadales bacterium]|jgi:hypothetical protein|nr:hypothetical protein [Pseudomonadales bacterium]
MRAELATLLMLAATPAGGVEDLEGGLPSAAFLEFLGGLVEVEGELLGPQDLDVLPAVLNAPGEHEPADAAADASTEDGVP